MTVRYKELKVTAWNPKGKSFHKLKIPHYEKNQKVSASYVSGLLKSKGVKKISKLTYNPGRLNEYKVSKFDTKGKAAQLQDIFTDLLSTSESQKHKKFEVRKAKVAKIQEALGRNTKPMTRAGGSTSGSYGTHMSPSPTDNKHALNAKKAGLKNWIKQRSQAASNFWADYEKKKKLGESRDRSYREWQIEKQQERDDEKGGYRTRAEWEKKWAEDKKKESESPFKGGDTPEKSTPYTNPHNKAKQLARQEMKKRMEKKLEEAKKYSPAELSKMSKRERGLLKMKVKAETKVRKEKKAAAPAPVKKARRGEEVSSGSRLDWFNSQPTLQKWLRANVHPADRERVMNDIWDAPKGKAFDVVDDYMAGKKPVRKPPKSTL